MPFFVFVSVWLADSPMRRVVITTNLVLSAANRFHPILDPHVHDRPHASVLRHVGMRISIEQCGPLKAKDSSGYGGVAEAGVLGRALPIGPSATALCATVYVAATVFLGLT